MENFNWVDYVVIGIVFFSVIVGLMRGFLKEVISLLTWVIAFFVASLFSGRLATVFTSSDQVQSAVDTTNGGSVSLVAVAISYVVIFIGVLIVGKLFNFVVSGVTGSDIGFINRLLGGIFGFARGVLIVLVMIFLIQLTPMSTQSDWQNSHFVNAAEPTIQKIDNMVEPHIQNLKSRMSQSVTGMNNLYQQGLNSLTESLSTSLNYQEVVHA